MLVSTNIFNHNQHTLYESFYYVTTCFDPELGSLSSHDTIIWMYTVAKYSTIWKSFSFTLNTLFKMYVHCKRAKFALQQAPKAQRGRRGIALLILDLGDRRRWVVSTTPRPLYPRERPGTHCTEGWEGGQGRSGRV
jgi:hypothetical protein